MQPPRITKSTRCSFSLSLYCSTAAVIYQMHQSCCFLILSSWFPAETRQIRFLVCDLVPGDILPEADFFDIFQNLSDIVFCVTASLSGDQSRRAVWVHNQSKCFWGQQFASVRILLEIWLMDWVQCHLWDRWEKQVYICWTSGLGSDRKHVICIRIQKINTIFDYFFKIWLFCGAQIFVAASIFGI